jgi:hypothetical protein
MSTASGSPQAYLTVMKFRDIVVLLSDTPNGLRPLSDWNTVFKTKTFRRIRMEEVKNLLTGAYRFHHHHAVRKIPSSEAS